MSGWSKIPTFHWHLHVVPPKNKSVTLPESISWSPDVTRPIGRPDAVSVQGCCRGKRSHRKCRHVPHELMVKATTSSMLDMTWLVKKPVFVGEFPVHPRLTLTLISHKYIYIHFLNLRCIISHYVSNTFPFWLVESSLLPPQYSRIAMEHPPFSSIIFRLKAPIYMGFPIATFD